MTPAEEKLLMEQRERQRIRGAARGILGAPRTAVSDALGITTPPDPSELVSDPEIERQRDLERFMSGEFGVAEQTGQAGMGMRLAENQRIAARTTPVARAPLSSTEVPDLSALKEDAAAEQTKQNETQDDFVSKYLTRFEREAPTFESYTPKVFGLDKGIAKERDRIRADIEQRRVEIQDMEETDRLIKSREEKVKAAENLRSAEKMIEDYKPTDQGPLSTTGSKVAAAIAIVLGEAARGLRRGEGRNVGMDLINQAIDREAKRQQDEYNRLKDRANFANNIYARAIQEFGNAESAFETAKAALWNRAYQTASTQLEALRGNADADRFLKDALNNKEIQMARNVAAQNKATAQAFAAGRGGVSESLQAAAGKAARNAGALVGEFKEAREILSKIDGLELPTQLRSIIASADQGGISNTALRAVGTAIDPDFQKLVNFYNRINAIAFGQAAEGQAASSISNKDVAIFRNLLANPIISQDEISNYLGYLQDKASANTVYNRVLASGRASIQDALDASDEYMVDRLGYTKEPDGSFSKGNFDQNRSATLASQFGNLEIKQRVTGQ